MPSHYPEKNNKCSTMCNLPCEQLFLEQNVSYTMNAIRITSTITNISGRNIRGPLILVSSLTGNKLLTTNGIAAGETRKITQTYNITKSNVMDDFFGNVSFIARGVPAPDGSYTPAERMSPVKSEKIVNEFIVLANAYVTRSDPYSDGIVTIKVTKVKPGKLIELIVYIRDIWENEGSPVRLESGNEYFMIDNNKNLILIPGVDLELGTEYTAAVYLVFKKSCQKTTAGSSCLMNYFSKNEQRQNTKTMIVETPP